MPATHHGTLGNSKAVIGKPIVSSLVLRLLCSAFNPTRDASLKRTRTRAISAIKKIMVEYGGLVMSMYPVTSHQVNIPATINII